MLFEGLVVQEKGVFEGLKNVADFLIEKNIYCCLGVENCGFDGMGRLRVYIPPLTVL